VEMGGAEERLVARIHGDTVTLSVSYDQGIVRQREPKKMVIELTTEEQDSSWRTLQQQFLFQPSCIIVLDSPTL